MQDYNPIQPTALISQSRATINNNMDSLASHFSGSYFPTNNLQAGMYCWRTDVKQMYQLNEDLVNWTLVNDMSQGYNSVAHANRADYASKDADGNEIAKTYSKQKETNKIILQCYPVGSIYMSVNSTDPGTLFGGTWQRIADGRVLIGAGSSYVAGSIGGNERLTPAVGDTTLTLEQIPLHSHKATVSTEGTHAHSYVDTYSQVVNEHSAKWDGDYNVVNRTQTKTTSSAGSHNHTVDISSVGGGEAHTHAFPTLDIRQPYLVVNIWKRVS